MRIGMRANQENDCKSCDSWIDFGRSDKIKWLGSGTCGNFALGKFNKGQAANHMTMGYILIK